MTDYYQSLELPRDATQEQIRRNYRQLALRFHRDRAGPEGAERLKETQSAYEVLLNPQKRKIYDRFGASFVHNPVSEVLILQLGGRSILCIMACIPFLSSTVGCHFYCFSCCIRCGSPCGAGRSFCERPQSSLLELRQGLFTAVHC
ncbi:DnaJ chaperone protein [Trypanosoma cruzi cruzi]|nr:DnaJ chaperone protein [Trypanosoma cruzi cruzi]PBJ75806.1 DnaJ chaperone protein [Trypanosoma cruzi cruzi]